MYIPWAINQTPDTKLGPQANFVSLEIHVAGGNSTIITGYCIERGIPYLKKESNQSREKTLLDLHLDMKPVLGQVLY